MLINVWEDEVSSSSAAVAVDVGHAGSVVAENLQEQEGKIS